MSNKGKNHLTPKETIIALDSLRSGCGEYLERTDCVRLDERSIDSLTNELMQKPAFDNVKINLNDWQREIVKNQPAAGV